MNDIVKATTTGSLSQARDWSLYKISIVEEGTGRLLSTEEVTKRFHDLTITGVFVKLRWPPLTGSERLVSMGIISEIDDTHVTVQHALLDRESRIEKSQFHRFYVLD